MGHDRLDKAQVQDLTLFFCVGATKAGTSWLHSQLQAHPECHLKSIKELHYFSMTQPRQFERALKTAQVDAVAAQVKAQNAAPEKRDYAGRRAQDLTEWCEVLKQGLGAHDRYLAYLSKGVGRRHVIGDVTPGYSLMPAETLTMMGQLTPDVRFVYLMRDPVERLWSHIRMVCARAERTSFEAGNLQAGNVEAGNVEAGNFEAGSLRLIEAILAGEVSNEITGILKRGDYCAIMDKLDRAVPATHRLVAYYEDMFAPGGLNPICDFLGIAAMIPAVETKVHAGMPLTLTPDLVARTRAFLQPQYAGVRQRLGAVPPNWAQNAA